MALSWWCPCPVYDRCFLPCCAWTFTAPTILHWTVSPMIDVEITPEAQCRDGGRPASLALHLYVFPSDLSSFYLLVPLSDDHPFCLESASFTPWRIYPPPPPGQLGVEQSSRMDEFLIKRFINQANIFRKSQIFSIVISFNLFSSRTKRDVLALNLLDRKGGNNTVARFAYRRVMIRLVNSTTAA